jgi:hypothetical protein
MVGISAIVASAHSRQSFCYERRSSYARKWPCVKYAAGATYIGVRADEQNRAQAARRFFNQRGGGRSGGAFRGQGGGRNPQAASDQ